MAHNLIYSIALNQARFASLVTTVGGSALLKIYDGTQPASPDTAIGAQVLLATLTCNATLAPAASSAHPSVLTLNSISSATAGNTSTASWFRLTQSGGTAEIDGSAGVGSTFDLNLNSTSITSGQTVSVTAGTFTSAT